MTLMMQVSMPKKVIIDCDPGIDDSLALLLALNSPELDVIGLTIVAGNVPVELGAANALKVLELLDRQEIPVYLGESRPIARDLITAQDTHGEDGLGETDYTYSNQLAWKSGAVDFLLENANDQVHLITLGPYTNLARLVEKDSEAINRFASIISMGGNYMAQGNCSEFAEFNFWVDPESVQMVFENMLTPITMVGLDVTRSIVLTPDHRDILKQINSKVAGFIYDITQFYVDFHLKQEGLLGCVINDPLAIAQFIDPSICTGFFGHLEMINNGVDFGRSMISNDEENLNVEVLTAVNTNKFFELFFKRVLPTDYQKLTGIN